MPISQSDEPALPQTVEEAVERLLVIVDQSSQDWIRDLPGEELGQLHFGFGTQIRNEFGLWHSNASLRQSSGSAEIHPETASGVLIRSFWKRLNNRIDWQVREGLDGEPL